MSVAWTIGMVLFPDATQLDFTGPYEVFSRIPNTKVYVIAHERDVVTTERGLKIYADTTFDTCPPLDVLFIPGGPGQIKAQGDEKLMRFIESYGNKPNCIISSVCTGALLLGAAGLLKNKKATTHWTCLDILPFYGAIPVDAPVVEDGNFFTGAGVSNGIDLALRLADKMCGEEKTKRIARQIEYPHASAYANKAEIEKLSKIMLAENPSREVRINAAKQSAKKLGIQI